MIGRCRQRGSVNIARKPAFHQALRERLCCLLEQPLDVSPRQAERAGDLVEIEIAFAEAPPDLCDDRAQPGSLHTALRNDFCSFGGRPERCGDEVEKVNADSRSQFERWGLFEGRERSQITAEQVEGWIRMHCTTCVVLGAGY